MNLGKKLEMGLHLLVVLFVFGILCGICNGGIEYKVGDDFGWAVNGNMDFNNWASTKPFHVDDTLIFAYDRQNHNVLQVNRSSFHSCDTTAPIATYTTGNDYIVIRGPGHYYYICGFVGHCQAGQKVDIRVPKVPKPVGPASIPISGPIQTRNESSAPLASFTGPMAPSPSISDGHSHTSCNGLFAFSLGLLLIIIRAFSELL